MASSIGTESRHRAALAAALVVSLLAAPAPLRAEVTAVDKSAALSLFEDARRAFGAGRFAEACPKFEGSQRLDPQLGTLLNLAICHEKLGKLASAWLEYTEGRDQARRDKRTERLLWIEQQLDELRARVPHVVVEVPEASRIAGLQVLLDGAPIREQAWGVELPIDPGEHELVARAEKREPSRERFIVAGEGEKKRVAVRPLAPEVAAVVPVPQPSAEQPSAPAPRSLAPIFVSGGVALVGVGVGSFFGVRALSLRSDAEAACTRAQCATEGQSLNRRASAAAWISDVGFSVGLIGAGIAAYYLLTGASPRTSARARAALVVTPTGVSLSSSF